MLKQIEVISGDPFLATLPGWYEHTGQLHYRSHNGTVLTIFDAPLPPEISKQSTAGSSDKGIDGEQLIRIIKIAAHINSPGKVEKL